MSEEQPVESRPEAADSPRKNGLGCGGWLGIAILIAAAGAVIFYFILRPALRNEGVDVDAELKDWGRSVRYAGEKALERLRGAGQAAKETVDRTAENAEHAADHAERAAAAVGDAAGQAAGRAAETAEEVKSASRSVSRQVRDAAEKTGDAWY